MIPSSTVFDEAVMAQLLTHDPLVQEYRTFFALFDWSVVEDWNTTVRMRDVRAIR